MRVIPAALHQVLDYITIAAFAVAPSLIGLAGFAAALSYALAAIHLAMTLLTRFSAMGRRPVPLGLHGVVESVVGVVLVVLPWLAGWHGTPRIFYTAAGVTILLVWALSHYGMPESRAAA